MKFKKVTLRLFTVIMLLLSANACHHYKIGKVKSISAGYIVEKDKMLDYLIVHVDDEIWNLQNARSENDQILGVKQPISPYHNEFTKNQYRSKNVYQYKKNNSSPANEVHIYVSKVKFVDDGEVLIHIDDISKVEVYDEAVGANLATTVLPVAVIVVAAAGAVVWIACACPYAYTYDSSGYKFQGGIFPGAINAQMEREDYKVLDGFVGSGDRYSLKLANEKPETEYINLAELRVIQHPLESEALYTKYGELLTFSNTQSARIALASDKTDIKAVLNAKDNQVELFNKPQTSYGMNEVILNFDNPGQAKQAKLILRAKNSRWMDHTFKEFLTLFGDYYKEFSEYQKEQAAHERITWMKEQGVLLNVYLDKGRGWEYYDYFNVVGSTAYRDLAMKLNLADMENEVVRVKLQSGFNFWELDYVAIDFGHNVEVLETTLQALVAQDQHQKDYRNALSKSDKEYVAEMVKGDELFLEYEKPVVQEGLKTTVILHSKGYYELDYEFHGKADLVYLRKFKKKGRLSGFSRDKYYEILNLLAFSKTE